MSSMRNAIQRRPHRERAQPLERRRLGLLEKHKVCSLPRAGHGSSCQLLTAPRQDYSLRAADYGKKKAQLKSLRQKAADRNEDEFYFGMMSRKGPGSRITSGKGWDGTVQGDRGNKALDMETVRLLKTQDMGYVRTMRQVVSKEVVRLEEQVALARGLHLLDGDGDDSGDDYLDSEDNEKQASRSARRKLPRKIVFMDDVEERAGALQNLDAADQRDERKVENEVDDKSDRAKSFRRLKRQLEDARKKLKALTDAERELETQRTKMAKKATSGGQTRRSRKIMIRKRKR